MKRKNKNKFDFNAYAKLSTPDEKFRMLDGELKESEYLVLSDPMVYRTSGGVDVLKYIGECSNQGGINPNTDRRDRTIPCTWKLKLLKHKNGQTPKPGDKIEWVTQRKNHLYGKKIGTTQARDLIRRGESDKLTETNVAVLDKDCCFLAGYDDASQLLSNNGVYFRTGYPISNLPEHFRGNQLCHNWRFIEVPPWNDPKDSTPWNEKQGKLKD